MIYGLETPAIQMPIRHARPRLFREEYPIHRTRGDRNKRIEENQPSCAPAVPVRDPVELLVDTKRFGVEEMVRVDSQDEPKALLPPDGDEEQLIRHELVEPGTSDFRVAGHEGAVCCHDRIESLKFFQNPRYIALSRFSDYDRILPHSDHPVKVRAPIVGISPSLPRTDRTPTGSSRAGFGDTDGPAPPPYPGSRR